MNILIDNGSYNMDNLGDVAMLQVCVARVRRRWPEARIRVLVEMPDRLRRACPDVEPLMASPWHVLPIVPKTRRLRGDRLRRLERRVFLHVPHLAYVGKRRSAASRAGVTETMDRFYHAVRDADAVMCSGGGFFNDWHAEHADKVIQTLAIAQGMGKPTAMFGAGLGPITDHGFRRYARPVLTRLDMLALREHDHNHEELAAMRVPLNRSVVTGDDAITLALDRGEDKPRDAIGINIRLAAHAQTSAAQIQQIAPILRQFADERGVPLLAAPVRSHLSPDNDVDAVCHMFGGEGGVDLDSARRIETPVDLIRCVGRCRVMITGAYHSAVFALAQGIPVVALAGNAYYERKFGGLEKLFGTGIRILKYDTSSLTQRFREAVRAAWVFNEGSDLTQAAQRQVTASEAAYDTFFNLVERRSDGIGRRAVCFAGRGT